MNIEEFELYTVENWDTEGAKPISKTLFESANLFINVHKDSGEPDCNPCCDGSLDYVFRSDKGALLINIRDKGGLYEASFYGYYKNGTNEIKGIIPLIFSYPYQPLYEWIKTFLNDTPKETKE